MGLDSVELLMEFEDQFGITITDEEATETRTPRMVIDLVLSKLEVKIQTVCWSQRAFYLLRGALTEFAGAPRGTIRPDSELRGLIGPDHVARVWPALELAIQAKVWPSLVRPPLLVTVLWVVSGAIWLGLFAAGMASGITLAIGTALLGTAAFAVAAILATERWRRRLPNGLTRIRDLVPYAGSSERIEWTREKVATMVKVIVMEQLGLPESDYREDADFVRDFSLG